MTCMESMNDKPECVIGERDVWRNLASRSLLFSNTSRCCVLTVAKLEMVARSFSTWKEKVGSTLDGTNVRICWYDGMQPWLDSDSSSHFKTTAVQEWGEDCAAEWVYHIASNPQASGKVEWYNGLLETALQGNGVLPLWSWGEERVNIKVGTHHNSPAENHILQFQLGDKAPASPGDIRIETQVRVYSPAAIEIPKEGVLIAWGPGITYKVALGKVIMKLNKCCYIW